MTSSDDDDDELFDELGALIRRVTELPADQHDIAKGLFAWRTVDAELADLTGDSLLDTGPTGQRTHAGAQPRLLTFEVAGFSIHAELGAGHEGRRLIGQIVPAGAAEITLQSEQEQTHTRADDHGRFVLPLPSVEGRVRLRCVTAERTVETAWVLV